MCTIAVELDLVGEKIYNSVTGSWICVIVIQIVVDTTNTFSEKWWWFTHRSQSDIPQYYEAGYRETRLRGGMRNVTLHRLYASEPIADLSS